MHGTVPQRQLARRLRKLRENAGLTLQEAADRIDCSKSRLSRIEKAQHGVDVPWVKEMLDAYGADDVWLDMVKLAKIARQPGWWRAYGLDNKGYVPLEAAASRVREFNLAMVPGLLQTYEYTRALFRSALVQVTEEDQHRGALVRARRQQRLTADEDPLELVAILDESVLYRPVGGPTVLRNQLRHLLSAAKLDTVTLQVLPTGTAHHPGLDGGFTLLSFDDPLDPDLAYVEHVAGAVHLEKPDELARCTLAFDRLRSIALSSADSTALVERLITPG